MSTTLRVLGYLKRYPMLASLQLLCAIVGTLMVVVFPKITQEIIDVVIPEKQGERLFGLVMIGLGAFFARDFLNSMRIMVNNVFEQKVIYDLRSDLYEKIQRLPLRWFDNRPTGDIMTRVSEDVQAMERVLIDGIEQGAVAILQILIVGIFMFSMNATLAATALIPMPFLIIGALWYTLTARDRYRENRKATSDMNSLLHDNIAGIRQIKTYTMEEEEHARFNRASQRVRRGTLRIMRAWACYNPSMSFFGAVGSIIVIGVGTNLALEGELERGELVAFLFFLALFYEPIARLHSLNQLIQSGRAAGERVFEILDSDEEPNMTEGEDLGLVKGRVVYEDVSFSYTDRMPTLTGVNLVAEPGQTIALVGPTGAGKSTIINLLTRFYEHDDGKVMIDGRCVSTLKKDGLRAAIGYVTQESFLFNGTVRENLVIARRDADDDALWDALRIANAEGFIRRMPDGLDTKSGGAWSEIERWREAAGEYRPGPVEEPADPAPR